MGGPGSGRRRVYQVVPICDTDLLYEIGKDRGFRTRTALCQHIVNNSRYPRRAQAYQEKIARKYFTHPDMYIIAHALKMTPAEFMAVFFPKLFQEVDGKIIAQMPPEVQDDVYGYVTNACAMAAKAKNPKANKNRTEVADFLKNLK